MLQQTTKHAECTKKKEAGKTPDLSISIKPVDESNQPIISPPLFLARFAKIV